MPLDNNYSIIPPSGAYGSEWPSHFVLPQGASGQLSTGGWTLDDIPSNNFGNEGFVQQTFLGASIQSFDLNAGFGDTVSTLSLSLVNDEFNPSDTFGYGAGDDPYHGGEKDTFLPPVVGTPVYFKFGKNPANIEQAFRQTFDDLYGIQTLPTKVNPNNAWGWFFPQSAYDPDNFPQLEPYHMVNLSRDVIEDRSQLWDDDTEWRGRNHFAFGGILQAYTQNKSQQGKPIFSVTVTDPREILSNVEVLLNNYQGTTFNNKNIINLYGFLEYDPSTALLSGAEQNKRAAGVVEKVVDDFGNISYVGMESSWNSTTGWETIGGPIFVQSDSKSWSKSGLDTYNYPIRTVNLLDQYHFGGTSSAQRQPEFFPITGQGFARRSDKGMPWYRIDQGLAAIFNYYGDMPSEYTEAGFGGQINFRGYNYVVDFTGIPTDKIPLLYYMDFDKIDLLSLAQELCDIISHELYVTLLPVIDHPACDYLYEYNNKQVGNGNPENIVAGIIRLDAIDKTVQPRYGAIKSYLDNLSSRGIDVENQDVGFELSNVVTDKFVVGAQETDMYFFSTERDRDNLWEPTQSNNSQNKEVLNNIQWDLRTQEQQQVIPYYGLLGDSAVSVPRGFGSFQQILLDTTSLNAFGVGNYYVATELELRAASVSYESWMDFLLSYNDVYVEDIAEHRALISTLSSESDQIDKVLNDFKAATGFDDLDDAEQLEAYLDVVRGRSYAVTVPRCVFHSDRPYMSEEGFPASPCSPPFGYPLYYKRATRIGIIQAGVANLVNKKNKVVTDQIQLRKDLENQSSPLLSLPSNGVLFNRINKLEAMLSKLKAANPKDDEYKKSKRYKALVAQVEEAKKVYAKWDELIANIGDTNDLMAQVQSIADADDPDSAEGQMNRFLTGIEKTAQKHDENARKVYDFVKKVADENLGKRFLVRLPKSANLNFNQNIQMFNGSDSFNIENGPFGFPPRPISASFAGQVYSGGSEPSFSENSLFPAFLQDLTDPANPNSSSRVAVLERYNSGAMKGNYNPFSEQWEWNYKPNGAGGFFNFEGFYSNISALEYAAGNIPFSALPLVMQNGVCPLDIANISDDNNRVKCYAKFHNSELLDFTSIQSSDMTQQSADGFLIPDIAENLPNNSITNPVSFNSIEEHEKQVRLGKAQPKTMAFVKCSVDEKLYMPPKLYSYNLEVWAREYEFKLSVPEPEINESIDPNTCEPSMEQTFKPPVPVFSIPKDGGRDGYSEAWTDFSRYYDPNLDGLIVDSRIRNLDDEHVYALVTLPGRIKPTLDSRWRDGPLQAFNAVSFKHLLTQDVVEIPPFSKPSFPATQQTQVPCGEAPVFSTVEAATEAANEYGLKGSHYRPDAFDFAAAFLDAGFSTEYWSSLPEAGYRPGAKSDWTTLSLEQISSARELSKTITKHATAGSAPLNLGYISPSPVFPDMIALPLMSMERCYGPWMSASQLDTRSDARVKYSNIGGKVEFIKDENLSPWSYAGYQLLDEAGALQANFSNSLLLFSERGGFVMPDAPTGIALATALQAEGPLITSIGITVDKVAGVKTTVKLDLYTSQFGKLQKQKEMAISQVARERQKSTDQRNAAIRRGLGKNQTSADLVSAVMNAGGTQLTGMVNSITNQIETNRQLGQDIDEMVIVAGDKGATAMTTKALEKVSAAYQDLKDGNVPAVATLGSLWTAIKGTSQAGISQTNARAIQDRINNNGG